MTKKDIELINLLIDDQLSEPEKKDLLIRIQNNTELNEYYNQLLSNKKAIQNTIKLKPEYYIEDKLIENKILKRKEYKMKKFIPILGILLVTVVVGLFYKYNLKDVDDFVEYQKSGLINYYTNNVKPLFVKTELNNEDVFNFAFNHIIPIDRDNNQYVKIGIDQNGKDYFEIKQDFDDQIIVSKQDFVTQFSINKDEEVELDKILSKYSSDIEKQVVLAENNAIGLNHNLWTLNKVIASEVLDYTQQLKRPENPKFQPIKLSLAQNKDFNLVVDKVTNPKNSEFVFLTPDTIFSTVIAIDYNKFDSDTSRHKYKKLKIKIDTSSKIFKYYKQPHKEYEISIAENSFKVDIPEIKIPDLPNVDSILKSVEKTQLQALKKLKITLEKNKEFQKQFELKIELPDSLVKLNIKMHNFDSIFKKEFAHFDTLKYLKFDKKNFKIDSLNNSFNFKFDSNFDKEKFRDEMEKFKTEMNKWKKELKEEIKNEIEKELKSKK